MKHNVLVFPCGSEIALEVYRSLRHSLHFNLIGASSVDDHGRFVYENYIDGVPFITSGDFIPAVREIVQAHNIQVIFPAMDAVLALLKKHEPELGCRVVGSPHETTAVCLSKRKTYEALRGKINIPAIYTPGTVESFPVFAKPDVGYGSRGARLVKSAAALQSHMAEYPDLILCEYLPGEEYTVDCFTDRHGQLRFCGPRSRDRVMNGISVNTKPCPQQEEFRSIARTINDTLNLRGAWFVQLKRNARGELVLMEVASRLGGSSSLFRNKGVNFAQLCLFDALDMEVTIIENDYRIELDRALGNKYRIGIEYDEVFIDFDDCIILDGGQRYNLDAIKLLYQCVNEHKKITLLSRHRGDLSAKLAQLHIAGLFDRVIHIPQTEKKSNYIDNTNAIFIDDSFSERYDVAQQKKIPVFSVDMIESLLDG